VQLRKRDVVEAATVILDNYGMADLTMRRLARELNITPSALYWHFANKQELLGAVADRILRAVPNDSLPVGWRDRTRLVCRGLRNALRSHTDAAELVSASFAAGQSSVMGQIHAQLASAAAVAGVAEAHAGLAGRTVICFVLAFTADEQSRLQWDAAGAALATSTLEEPDRSFEFGLGLLIDGIAAQADATVHLR
jgi:AcrR family transcriptional regulator